MDTKQAKLIGNILKFAIAIPGVIMVFLILKNGNVGIIDAAIKLTMVAMIACAVIALIFGVIYFLTHIKKSKGIVIGLLGFIAIIAISYSISVGNLTPEWEAVGITEKVSKLSGMGIYAVLILLGVAIAAALLSEVSKLIKG